jgi:ppGpp synthetase/RelA/SpoT-type nucleotidyltranferase
MPSKSPRTYYEEFASNFALYEDAAKTYRGFLSALVADISIQPPSISVRPKDALSLYKKLQKKIKDGKEYANPWIDCADLVGARVTVPLSSDKAKVLAALVHAQEGGKLESVLVDDKELARDPRSLTYSGLHAQICLPGLHNHRGDRISCEVQIRTAAEHTWAETEHKYIYKGPAEIPSGTRRTFARLLALVELLDQELDRGVTSVSTLESFALLRLSHFLEAEFRKVYNGPFSTVLTHHAVADVSRLGLYDTAGLIARVQEYTSTKMSAVQQLLVDHGPLSPSFDVDSDSLVTQPELLLYMALLDDNPHGLGIKLENSDMYEPVKRLALWTGERGFLVSS